MTRDETIAIMGILKTAYPRYYADMKRTEAEQAIALWAEMFAENPAETVAAAVKSFISTDEKGFPPHIGAIKSHVSKLTYGYQKTELEAWEEVRKVLSKANQKLITEEGIIDGAIVGYKSLDPIVQRIVGSPSQLREWARAETGTPINVIASNFQRSYKAMLGNHREYQSLPGSVAEIVDALAEAKNINPRTKTEGRKVLPANESKSFEKETETTEGFQAPRIPKPLGEEEFAKKREEILKELSS